MKVKRERILELFKDNLEEFEEDSKGNFKGPCPSCGSGGDNYGGFIIFPNSNTCYCFGSKTKFDYMETVALVNGIISCMEGRQ